MPDHPGYQAYHTTYSSENPNYYTSRAKPQTQATKRPVLAHQPPVRRDSLQHGRPATVENVVSRPPQIQTQVYTSQPQTYTSPLLSTKRATLASQTVTTTEPRVITRTAEPRVVTTTEPRVSEPNPFEARPRMVAETVEPKVSPQVSTQQPRINYAERQRASMYAESVPSHQSSYNRASLPPSDFAKRERELLYGSNIEKTGGFHTENIADKKFENSYNTHHDINYTNRSVLGAPAKRTVTKNASGPPGDCKSIADRNRIMTERDTLNEKLWKYADLPSNMNDRRDKMKLQRLVRKCDEDIKIFNAWEEKN